MQDLTGIQRDLLFVIAGLESPKGIRIQDELEEYYESRIDRGRLYPNLDTLVNEGLVKKDAYDERTNTYQLTQRGEQELKTRREWELEHFDAKAL